MTDAAAPLSPVLAGRVEPEMLSDGPAVEALVLAAFGPGRFAKTAERLRETARVAAGFVLRDGDEVIGSVRLWAITLDGAPALFLGPIAVLAGRRSGGRGGHLVQACLDYAGPVGVLLVGDPPYFSRFGFRAAAHARLPGPVDQHRVMWRGEGDPVGVVLPA